ncbi:MAG: DUF4331 domain-containing protein [Solirubrobacteraceae bacterium]
MRALKRAGAVRLLALIAALAAGVLAVSSSFGSSHREAPGTSIDPTGDDTDLYAFTASDAPGSITVVANWIPFEDPAGGPNFYRFDDRASYYVNVDNSGDGAYDVRYRFNFKTRYRNPKSFLYALPGVTSFNDPKLQQVQTYTVTREQYSRKGRRVSAKVIGRNLPVAPNNVGPKTIPNYDAVANGTIRSLAGGGKVFAGQREDPFFVDLGTTFDAINFRKGTGNEGGGKDDLAGYNVHSIVLQVPEAAVTVDGKSVLSPTAKNAVVGVWSSTERPRVLVAGKARKGGSVQVSRLGNPLVNEVVIPVGQKDKFNATQPKDDAKNYAGSVVKPELAAVINALFKLGVKETDRTDIVTALLTGIPGVTQIGSKPAAADTLKLNLGVPPTATPNRFGVIGGDNAGFPNGRRLGDDVVDIELRVIGGFLIPANQGGKQLPLGDGVDQNDRPFLATFPYVAPPFDGFDSKLKRSEPTHSPTPGDLKPPAP